MALSSGCGAHALRGPSPPSSPVVTLPKAAPPAPVRCTPTVDVAALLDRSARGYGSPAAVAADLPRWIRWTRTERDGASNHAEEIVDATRFREVLLAGAWTASGGVDAQGSWMNFSGPLVRLRAGDPPLRALHDWIVRRGYLTERAYDASCQAAKDGEGGPTVMLRARRPDLGDPELDLDATSGELRSVSIRFERTSSVASSERLSWSPPDERGVRWPVPATGPEVSDIQTGRGIRCTGRGGVTVTGDECLAATPSSMQVHWPQEGITRLPMTLSAGAPLVRVKIGDRDAWALLDSGAEACLVNASSPDAPRLTPSGSMDVEALTSVRVGPAIVDRLAFGGVTFTNVPAVVAPADLLYIDPLPAITFGYGLFESMAVRIDYARGEVVLARDAASLVGAGARRVPLRIASWAMLTDVQVEGQPAVLTVDTGTSPALLLSTSWTRARGIPGGRPTLLDNMGGPGVATSQTVFAVSDAQLGPITTPVRAAEVTPPDASFGEDGTLGDSLLAACAAVVFDVPGRSLWLEPPCNRSVPEDRSDMQLDRSDVFTIQPWVVKGVLSGGSADRAGLRVGDRLLEVGGAEAREDSLVHIAALMHQPAGTKVPVVVDREGEKKRIVVTLVNPASALAR